MELERVSLAAMALAISLAVLGEARAQNLPATLCDVTRGTAAERADGRRAWDRSAERCRFRSLELDAFVRRGAAPPDALTLEVFVCRSLAELAGERPWPTEGAAFAERAALRPSGCKGAESTPWGQLVDETSARFSAVEFTGAEAADPVPEYTWAWVATGTAVALLVGGSVLMADATGVSERLELEQARGADSSLLGGLHDRRVAEMAAGGVLVGVGAISTGLALWQFLEPPLAPKTRAILLPNVSESGAGLMFRVKM